MIADSLADQIIESLYNSGVDPNVIKHDRLVELLSEAITRFSESYILGNVSYDNENRFVYATIIPPCSRITLHIDLRQEDLRDGTSKRRSQYNGSPKEEEDDKATTNGRSG